MIAGPGAVYICDECVDLCREIIDEESAPPAAAKPRLPLAKLPTRQRQAIILHYLADTSVTDIAALTGAAEGTVKSWLHRGRAALAGYLGPDPGGEVTTDG